MAAIRTGDSGTANVFGLGWFLFHANLFLRGMAGARPLVTVFALLIYFLIVSQLSESACDAQPVLRVRGPSVIRPAEFDSITVQTCSHYPPRCLPQC